jgi:hypothetical protein
MTKYLLIVDYRPGVVETPMDEWKPYEVQAHMDYYDALNKELAGRGELVDGYALTGPELGKTVVAGPGAPVVTDGVFPESKEVLAGFQVVDVDSVDRAIEIAAQVSRVPGPGGVPLQQPISIRQVMGSFTSD